MDIYAKTVSTGKFELLKPIFVDEREVKELDFPISDMRGRDVVTAQEEFEVLTDSPMSGVLESNKNFLAYLAAKVAKIPYDTVLDMPIRDFNWITLITQRFLFRG